MRRLGWTVTPVLMALAGSAGAQAPPIQQQQPPPLQRQLLTQPPPGTGQPAPEQLHPEQLHPDQSNVGQGGPGLGQVAPVQVQSLSAQPLPQSSPTQLGQPGSDQRGSAPQSGSVPPAMSAPAVRPNLWIPQNTATLQVLNKVDAQAQTLTAKVGSSVTFGSLTIVVKACEVRPPDQPPDAAAFLVVTDSHPDSAGFQGWMLAAEPTVSMMQNPIYDIRVIGCS
jgi:hypothetical protein